MTTVEISRINDAFNAHDASAIAALYAADAVVYDPQYPEPLRGRSAIEQDMADWFRAFPDAQLTITAALQQDDLLAIEYSMRGTHGGPLAVPGGEIPATGKAFEAGVGIFHSVNAAGEIVEERRYYDLATIMSQLGIS